MYKELQVNILIGHGLACIKLQDSCIADVPGTPAVHVDLPSGLSENMRCGCAAALFLSERIVS